MRASSTTAPRRAGPGHGVRVVVVAAVLVLLVVVQWPAAQAFVLRPRPSRPAPVGVQRRSAPPAPRGVQLKAPAAAAAAVGNAGTASSGPPLVLDGETEVFCNREINMQQIRAVGFDMDYTLAQYNLPFELLAYDGAKEKLVETLGYPKAVLNFQYDSTYFRRGLVIDKQRGNVIKMDRHKYVRQAYHGFSPLAPAVRKELYMSSSENIPLYTESTFVNIDTLFLLVDAYLFAQLVEYKDRHPTEIKHSYATIYAHIRQCVDLCHRDGVIKDRVAEDPGAYIIPDPGMVTMLQQYKESGRKTFLVTNSLWEYTDVVMNFLVGNHGPRNQDWVDLFEVVVVGSRKPAFLEDRSAYMMRVNPADGSLWNVDGVEKPVDAFLKQGKVFQGGNWKYLLEMLELSSGDNVLYVGDHMYSDILRSKRSLGWRTCLVIPELAEEVNALQRYQTMDQGLQELRRKRLLMDEEVDVLYKGIRALKLAGAQAAEAELKKLQRQLADLEEAGERLDETIKTACLDYHFKFHPVWGKLFEAGFQESRFAKQVSTYACIYTTKASNLGVVSPERWFRTVRDTLPHDVYLSLGLGRQP